MPTHQHRTKEGIRCNESDESALSRCALLFIGALCQQGKYYFCRNDFQFSFSSIIMRSNGIVFYWHFSHLNYILFAHVVLIPPFTFHVSYSTSHTVQNYKNALNTNWTLHTAHSTHTQTLNINRAQFTMTEHWTFSIRVSFWIEAWIKSILIFIVE